MSRLNHIIFSLLIASFFTIFVFIHPQPTQALLSDPDQALTVRVDQIVTQKEITFDDNFQAVEPSPACLQAGPATCPIQTYQELTATVTKGPHAGDQITIVSGQYPTTVHKIYQPGEQLIVEPELNSQPPTYYVNDYYRQDALIILFIIFVVVVIFVTRFRGLKALLGMAYSFAIIFALTLPLIMAGHSPYLVALLTIVLILPPTFYFSHGFSRKTHAAILGTSLAMLLTIGLAYLAVKGVNLTGYGSEESGFIIALMGNTINIQALLLAGIMISALGTLNDVTVSQSAIVSSLITENPDLNWAELYKKSMQVGQDHIMSMVDTLILVYAGGSLPLLILIADSSRPFSEIINYELFAEEIVNMLVGSIGLILAVPITTAVACFFFTSD